MDISTNKIDLSSTELTIIKENVDAALVDIGDGIACLKFKTKANSLTQGICDMLNISIEETEKNYNGLVIGNQSKYFSAGANLAYIAKLASEKKWDTIKDFIEGWQNAHLALKYCKKPVVVAPYSLTFGGGTEITLHGYKVTIHEETSMGLVETGVGLIPAGGGIKEMLVRSIEKTNGKIIDETMKYIKEAWNIIVTGRVTRDGQDAINLGILRECDKVVDSNSCLISEAKNEVLKLTKNGFNPMENKQIGVPGIEEREELEKESEKMFLEGLISKYDKYIADKIAYVITGGSVPKGTMLSEKQIMDLELEVFLELCGQEKTLQRIDYMLKTGKKLKN